ncbi:hypothetical protein K438DRAFT_1992910 [Mycena galopus ATCC 62051]|nr:hypothetical protein K438DRAFT_1992910 [Mycena galopus ATCC 62051]
MTEYDSSPAAYQQFHRTQQRITNWADDTAHCASQYKSPFVPRSDVQGNGFYNNTNSRSISSSRSPTPSHRSNSHGSHRSNSASRSHGHPVAQTGNVRSPLRSHTIAVDTVSPNDSISQVSGQRSSHRSSHSHRRAHSHSPSRHTASPSRHSSSHQRSSRGPTTYVQAPTPQYGAVQYGMQYTGGGVQYNGVQYPSGGNGAVQYVTAPAGAYTVVYPSDRKVQVVYQDPMAYPPVPHATQEHHGGLLKRIFGSQSGKQARSRSVSVPRR